MTFEVNTAEVLGITDFELTELLTKVYVDEEFVDSELAKTLFEPKSVRSRGVIYAARDSQSPGLAGMVIYVTANSPECRIARKGEVEMHLLGVKPEYRRSGLGTLLVEMLINHAMKQGCSKIILWTQMSMYAAQKLYESNGFIHTRNMNRGSREFKVYEKELHG